MSPTLVLHQFLAHWGERPGVPFISTLYPSKPPGERNPQSSPNRTEWHVPTQQATLRGTQVRRDTIKNASNPIRFHWPLPPSRCLACSGCATCVAKTQTSHKPVFVQKVQSVRSHRSGTCAVCFPAPRGTSQLVRSHALCAPQPVTHISLCRQHIAASAMVITVPVLMQQARFLSLSEPVPSLQWDKEEIHMR